MEIENMVQKRRSPKKRNSYAKRLKGCMTNVCVIGRSIVMAGKVCGCDLFESNSTSRFSKRTENNREKFQCWYLTSRYDISSMQREVLRT
jgi:hypothetical protein